jgi:hypothetical protein
MWLDDDGLDFARLFRGGGNIIAPNFALHESLTAMANNELEDQVLESFIDMCSSIRQRSFPVHGLDDLIDLSQFLAIFKLNPPKRPTRALGDPISVDQLLFFIAPTSQ